jgi:hypothetical protein
MINEDILLNWKGVTKDDPPPLLSFDFRLQRAIRVVPISSASIQEALDNFDDTVGRIKVCMAEEAKTGKVIASWEKNATHEPTCDSRTYCPDYGGLNCPRVPGVNT